MADAAADVDGAECFLCLEKNAPLVPCKNTRCGMRAHQACIDTSPKPAFPCVCTTAAWARAPGATPRRSSYIHRVDDMLDRDDAIRLAMRRYDRLVLVATAVVVCVLVFLGVLSAAIARAWLLPSVAPSGPCLGRPSLRGSWNDRTQYQFNDIVTTHGTAGLSLAWKAMARPPVGWHPRRAPQYWRGPFASPLVALAEEDGSSCPKTRAA